MTGVGLGARHWFRPHTGEVAVRLQADSWGELLARAGLALAELQGRGTNLAGRGGWREITVTSVDRESLLIDWLNELVYLADAEQWVATEFAVVEADANRLVIRARGQPGRDVAGLVKAVTSHRVSVRQDSDGWVAEVVIDV